jgi:hypothetical protein
VPDGTPPARFSHYARGEPLRIFEYRSGENELLGYVCRFARSAGGIQELTLTWCENEQDKSRAWRWIQFPRLRPVYRAQRLDRDRQNFMLIVAGELCADELAFSGEAPPPKLDLSDVRRAIAQADEESKRAAQPFALYDIVSFPGGRSKVGEVDWSCARGRPCAIWFPHSAEHFRVKKGDPQEGELLPLERQPWRVAARKLQETLREHGAIGTFICEAQTTEELPDGWDPVQAMDAGWDRGRLFEWFQQHMASPEERAEALRLARGTAPTPIKASGSDPAWKAKLIREEGVGRLLAELHNVRMLLTHDDKWRGVIYLDDSRTR